MENKFDFKDFLYKNNLLDENDKTEKLLIQKKRIKLKCNFEITGNLPENIVLDNKNYDIAVSFSNEDEAKLIPKIITVGIGCRKDKAFEELFDFYHSTLKELKISEKSVEKIVSIDIKKNELGLIELAEKQNVPFITFSSEELLKAEGDFSSSGFVKSITGVDNVCERSAKLGSDNGKILLHKKAFNGMTISVAEKKYKIKF